MKNFIKFLFVALMSLLVGAKTSWAIPPSTLYSAALKADPVIWQFRTKVQAQGLIAQHINQPRAIYYIINQSYRYNLEGYVASNLVSRLRRDTENAKLTAMAAYACVQADGDGSRGLWGGGSPEANALMGSRSVILGLITPAVCKQLQDPALLVMAAVASEEKLHESTGDNTLRSSKEWIPSLSVARRAVAKDGKWADASYWYGRLLLSYHDRNELPDSDANRVLLKAKSNLLLASNLDPGLKGDCYYQLTFVLESLKQPQKALAYFTQAQKLRHPGFETDPARTKNTIERLQRKINDA